ncbi:MAG: hypothetical protein ACK5OS_02105 [Chryseotalea sp.]|jgi:hypothetical protein
MVYDIKTEIDRVLKKKGKNYAWLGEKLGYTEPHLFNPILIGNSIECILLAEISKHLEFDFFELYKTDNYPKFNNDKINEYVEVTVRIDGRPKSLEDAKDKLDAISEAMAFKNFSGT